MKIEICPAKQIESLNKEHSYIEKQLGSLKAASEPKKDELNRLEELKKIIVAEEKEIDRLVQGSKQLKEKVGRSLPCFFVHASSKPIIRDTQVPDNKMLSDWIPDLCLMFRLFPSLI